MHTIYSDDIKGVGLIIGGVYGEPRLINENKAQQGIQKAEEFASQGLIDNTSNIRNDPVWIFSGQKD